MSPKAVLRPLEPARLGDEGFRCWLGQTRPEWFREHAGPTPEQRACHLAGRLERLARAPLGRVVLLERKGSPAAVLGLERLAWDSEHFGFGIGRVACLCLDSGLAAGEVREVVGQCLEEALAWAGSAGLRLLSRRLSARRLDEARLLEERGFLLADAMLVLRRDLARMPPASGADPRVRPARPGDLAALLDMTRGAFPWSRFVTDPVYDPRLGAAVYVRWLESLLAGGGDAVLVAEESGAPAGYLTLAREDAAVSGLGRGVAEIGLFAVRPDMRGRGLGRALLAGALDQAACRGADLLEATTWTENRAALALYQGHGLAVAETLFTFHRQVQP